MSALSSFSLFSCCPEGDKELLFPSLVLILCWFGTRHRELFCRRTTGWSSSLCLFYKVYVYPQLHLFVCLCDQLQVGVLILPWKMLHRWQHLSASDSCVAVDLGFLSSHKPNKTLKPQAHLTGVKQWVYTSAFWEEGNIPVGRKDFTWHIAVSQNDIERTYVHFMLAHSLPITIILSLSP